MPWRRFQESPVALPKRPGRGHTEGICSWGPSGSGGGGGPPSTLPPLKEGPPARVHVGTDPRSAGGP